MSRFLYRLLGNFWLTDTLVRLGFVVNRRWWLDDDDQEHWFVSVYRQRHLR